MARRHRRRAPLPIIISVPLLLAVLLLALVAALVATPATHPAAAATTVAIHDIQGAAHLSPYEGQVVQTEGIVTVVRTSGFYLTDQTPDDSTITSEGLFVFTGAGGKPAVGDVVRVTGTVTEFRPGGVGSTGLTVTELTAPTVTVVLSGYPLPAAVVIGRGGRIPPATIIEDDATGDVETSGVFDPASDGLDFYESLEGMLVQVNEAVVVGPTYLGTIAVLADDGADAALRSVRGALVARAGDQNPERIILSDDLATLPPAKVGDHFAAPLVGVVDYAFGSYQLMVVQSPTVVAGSLSAETASGPAAHQLSVATLEAVNLDYLDPQADFDDLAEIIVARLQAPDLIALEQIQDDNGATDDAVVSAALTFGRLVQAVQAAGGPTYSYRQIDPQDDQDGGEPGGNNRQGFLFRTDRGLAFVDRPGGDATTATAAISGGGGVQLTLSPGRTAPTNAAFDDCRKPLAGEFTFRGDRLFVVAERLVSRAGDDPLFGRYQPPVTYSEPLRVQQAQLIDQFVDNLLALDAQANVIVLGDFNDTEYSSTLDTLEGGVLANLTDSLPAQERYSFIYQGNAQAVSHILVSPALFARPLAADVVHVGAEFADAITDHDPVLAHLCPDLIPPVLSVSVTPALLWPATHKYVTVKATVSASDNSGVAPTIALVSVTSNEPDDGPADGNTSNDIVIVDNTTFQLRAERSGQGTGRIYTIAYQATDACGNATTASATVGVPLVK